MTPVPSALLVARQTLLVLLPELLLILMATVMMTAGAFTQARRSTWAAASTLALIAAIGLLVAVRDVVPDAYSSVVLNDAMSGYCRLAFLLTGLIIVGLSYNQVDDARAAEFFGALLFLHAGAMLVAAANELAFLFVALELVSIPTYLLLYLPRRNATTQEAATKYFFLSIFSSALLLFGFAYLYGLTGLSNLKALSYLIHWHGNQLPIPHPEIALIALVFILAGLGFRVAAVPFHWYAPDVYEGSPTIMAAVLAWVPKGVGFIAMIRVLSSVFGWERGTVHASEGSYLLMVSDRAALVTGILAIVTLTLGNCVALRQDNLRRLLAYSSIAHAGYLLIGLAAAFRNPPTGDSSYLGSGAILLYLATYALMTLGAFGVIVCLSTPDRPVETVDDLGGLGRTHPAAALAMGLCLFSLAGVPPLAGFIGKFWIFSSALSVAQGPDFRGFLLLAIIGVLNSAIGACYYLRVLMKMTFSPAPAVPVQPRAGWPAWLAVGACASLSLFLGIYAEPLVQASRESAVAAVTLPEVGAPTKAIDASPIRTAAQGR